MLFGIYWRRTSPTATVASMVVGAGTAIVWTVVGRPLGLHGFIAGTAVALVIILVGTIAAPVRRD
jgi:Na+/pantothenate symporter